MKYDLIELCCGLGAVTWAAVGAPPPVVSRIGSKRGYTEPILSALGIDPGTARNVLMVDSDETLARAMWALVNESDLVAEYVDRTRRRDPRVLWVSCRDAVMRCEATPAEWFLWTAGARGGIGGFKGGHIRRKRVDGFIPSRGSLAERLRNFQTFFHTPRITPPTLPGNVFVACRNVAKIDPTKYEPTAIFIDPPYPSRTGYGAGGALTNESQIGFDWRRAGHRVVISLDRPLPGWEAREITGLRRGQTRRSLTRDSVEWLNVGGPA